MKDSIDQLKLLIPTFESESFLSGFEMALLNSIKQLLPSIETKGCLFHLNQNCYRKISELGFWKKYNTNSDFQVSIKSFPALAFLPVEQVVPAFERLSANTKVPPAFTSYIGRSLRSREVPPKYSIDFWNARNRVLQDLPKANNGCEGFHSALASSITTTHPNVWKLLQSMRTEMSLF